MIFSLVNLFICFQAKALKNNTYTTMPLVAFIGTVPRRPDNIVLFCNQIFRGLSEKYEILVRTASLVQYFRTVSKKREKILGRVS